MLAAQRQEANSDRNSVAGLPSERRGHHRHEAIGLVARIDALGVVGLARIYNLSDGGAMLGVSDPPALGSPVRISFDCTNFVQSSCWRSNGFIGVQFPREIACGEFIGKVARDRWNGKICAPRMSCDSPAQVKCSSGSFATRVSDVSEEGMKICPGGGLQAGTRVEITLRKELPLFGIVRWSVRNFAGIEVPGKIPAKNCRILDISSPFSVRERRLSVRSSRLSSRL